MTDGVGGLRLIGLFKFIITQNEGNLYVQYGAFGDKPQELFAESETRFFLTNQAFVVDFQKEADDRSRGPSHGTEPKSWTARRSRKRPGKTLPGRQLLKYLCYIHNPRSRVKSVYMFTSTVDIQRLERSGAYLLILDLTNVTYALFQRSDIFLKCV